MDRHVSSHAHCGPVGGGDASYGINQQKKKMFTRQTPSTPQRLWKRRGLCFLGFFVFEPEPGEKTTQEDGKFVTSGQK